MISFASSCFLNKLHVKDTSSDDEEHDNTAYEIVPNLSPLHDNMSSYVCRPHQLLSFSDPLMLSKFLEELLFNRLWSFANPKMLKSDLVYVDILFAHWAILLEIKVRLDAFQMEDM